MRVAALGQGETCHPGARATVRELKELLNKIRILKMPKEQPTAAQRISPRHAAYKVSGLVSGEPSFTQLFSHDTWSTYTAKSPFLRWGRTLAMWRFSTVLRSTLPICTAAAIWALCVASLPSRLLAGTSPVPITLMGSAIGLLLVFRTNNLYGRLMEARLLWGRAVWCCRQAAQTIATSMLFDESLEEPAQPAAHAAAAQACRYLAAFPWELNAKLTGKDDGSGRMRDLQPGEDLEVLQALLPPREAQWVGQSRSRPLHLLGATRRVLHDQLRAGRLHHIVYRKLEEDLKELDLVVGGCERLYSSPVPPTMSRHAIRSITLWLLGLPFVLAGSMPPAAVALWTFATSYIFVGIEETGAQVENPFEVLPMTHLCNVVLFNIEEAIALPP